MPWYLKKKSCLPNVWFPRDSKKNRSSLFQISILAIFATFKGGCISNYKEWIFFLFLFSLYFFIIPCLWGIDLSIFKLGRELSRTLYCASFSFLDRRARTSNKRFLLRAGSWATLHYNLYSCYLWTCSTWSNDKALIRGNSRLTDLCCQSSKRYCCFTISISSQSIRPSLA